MPYTSDQYYTTRNSTALSIDTLHDNNTGSHKDVNTYFQSQQHPNQLGFSPQQQQQQLPKQFPISLSLSPSVLPSPPSSIPSPTSVSSSLSSKLATLSPQQSSAYSAPQSGGKASPRPAPFGYIGTNYASPQVIHNTSITESQDIDMYPLDLSLRSAPRPPSEDDGREELVQQQHRGSLANRPPRLDDVPEQQRYRHSRGPVSTYSRGSNNAIHDGLHHHPQSLPNVSSAMSMRGGQHRLSPYPLLNQSPPSPPRGPVGRTDSPVYSTSRRRTPSPAYQHPALLALEGTAAAATGYRYGHYNISGMHHLHPQQLQNYPPPHGRHHLSPSPSSSSAVISASSMSSLSENSSSPPPFQQILTSSDTVLHGLPVAMGAVELFKPYQGHIEGDADSVANGTRHRLDEPQSTTQHQQLHDHEVPTNEPKIENHDPRRQHLRKLRQHQKERQEEEKTYMDLDCHTPAHISSSSKSVSSQNSSPSSIQSHTSTLNMISTNPLPNPNAQSDASVKMMEVGLPNLSRQCSTGFNESVNVNISQSMEDGKPESKLLKSKAKSELDQIYVGNESNTDERMNSSGYMPPPHNSDRLIEEPVDETSLKPYSHHTQNQQKIELTSARHGSEQTNTNSEHLYQSQTFNHQQHQQLQQQHQEITSTASTTTKHNRDDMASSTHNSATTSNSLTLPSNDVIGQQSTVERSNSGGNDQSNPGISQDVLEEAKLMAFLSKTTLFTVKHEGEIPGSSSVDNKKRPESSSSVGNIFANYTDDDLNESQASGSKAPKLDLCVPQTSTSCKSSLLGPKRICFRLVDLVGLLVEQSLRA